MCVCQCREWFRRCPQPPALIIRSTTKVSEITIFSCMAGPKSWEKKNLSDSLQIHLLMVVMYVSYRKTCLAAIDPKPVGPEAEMSLLYFTQTVFSSYLQYWQHIMRENETEKERDREPLTLAYFFPPWSLDPYTLKHICRSQEDIMCDCPSINNGNINKF